MKQHAFLLTLILSASLLTGCGPVYQTRYTFQPPHNWHGRKCVNRCLAERSQCYSNCRVSNQMCRNSADMEALPSYLNYAHEQRKAGQPVYDNVNDFADKSGCYSNCGCASSYRECYENCGGIVTPYTVCTAFCPQPQPVTQNNLVPAGIR